MKKILLTTAAIAAISTSAFADLMDDKVYLTGSLLGSYFTKFNSGGTTFSTKIKPQFGFGIDLGAGYSIMDNLRAEVVYNHPFASNMKGSRNISAANLPAGLPAGFGVTQRISIKHKPIIHAVFARLTGDVVDLGMAKLFLSGGLGWANVKDKATGTVTVLITPPVGPTITSKGTRSYKFKSKNNFAYSIGGGAAFDVAEGVHLDVAYSYRDYGKANSIKKDDETLKAVRFKSHNISVGARFDI